MKYRLKPVEVDAVQWWPPGDERHDPVATPVSGHQVQCRNILGRIYPSAIYDEQWYVVCRPGIWATLVPGDWIVTKPDGSICRIMQKEFEAQYERCTVSLDPGDWATKTADGRVHCVQQEEFDADYENVD